MVMMLKMGTANLTDNCKHESTYVTEVGFVMCNGCEKILEVPTISDLALAYAEGSSQ